MSDALLSGVSGLKAHQKMLDVAGNNLANVNTAAFKSSRVSFAEMLSETMREASQPTATTGGTNPMQIGSGVQVASVDRDMSQGSLVNTGQPLDMAIEGAGFFVLSDGRKDVYTRAGAFAVDAQFYLVDPSTGYRVQRSILSEGVSERFQEAANTAIRIPYDVALPAQATTELAYTGNLSADEQQATTTLLASGMQYTKNGAIISTDTLLSQMDQANHLATADVISILGTRRDGSPVSSNFTVTVGTTTNQLSSAIAYTHSSGTAATVATKLADLDQASNLTVGDKINLSGTDHDGTTVTATYTYAADDTVQELLDAINAAFSGATATIAAGEILLTDTASGASRTSLSMTYTGSGTFDVPEEYVTLTTGGGGSTMGDLLTAITLAFSAPSNRSNHWSSASISNGEIRLGDAAAGYSQTDLKLESSDSTALTFPSYFKMLSAGGQASRNTSLEIFDSQGIGHTLSASFVRSNTASTWDLVVTSVSGDVDLVDRRIKGVTFLANGSYGGLASALENQTLQMTFGHDLSVRTLAVNMGTIREYDGLSQFGGTSTVTPSGQDGYASGWLSSLSVSNEGVLVGVFTNGVRQDVAAIRLATFQNAAGLQSVGNNYYEASTNSGTEALASGAGTVRGGALEKGNVNIAVEFVNLMQAQNGFQANARTIKVANEMLRELTQLM